VLRAACPPIRQNTKVIPFTVVIEMVDPAAPGVDESDFIRWVGVAVAVVGAVLATPDASRQSGDGASKDMARWWRSPDACFVGRGT
jgi:hypothetical protein